MTPADGDSRVQMARSDLLDQMCAWRATAALGMPIADSDAPVSFRVEEHWLAAGGPTILLRVFLDADGFVDSAEYLTTAPDFEQRGTNAFDRVELDSAECAEIAEWFGYEA